MLLRQASNIVARRFSTTATRQTQEWQQLGVPGSNLPFDIRNKYKLTLTFALYFGSALSSPFLIVRRHLLMQSYLIEDTIPAAEAGTKSSTKKEVVEKGETLIPAYM